MELANIRIEDLRVSTWGFLNKEAGILSFYNVPLN
jgi:hypothetical protein